MEIQKNNKPLERKHILIRALSNKNITQEAYDKEISTLETEIQKNLAEVLAANDILIRSEIVQVKKLIHTDGNMKRGIAKTLITFLEEYFTADEIRGIFRQGYKLQRVK